MEFALTDEQQMLQETVKSYLADASSLDMVRQIADGDDDGAAIAGGLNELGVSGLLIPEQYGGLGLGLVEAILIQEALGGTVCPAPFMTQALAVIGINTAGDEQQKSDLLPKIISGDARFGIAIAERVGARADAGVNVDGDKLSGTALFAMESEGATHLLVSDQQGGLHVVDCGAAGLKQAKMKTIDRTRKFQELMFDGVSSVHLSAENQAGTAADRMVAAGRILLAADTLGAGQYMLDAAVAYAKEREQFGRVIGSFQAVKHLCAEMAAKLEPSRALVWQAAYALETGDDEGALLSCLAKSHLSEVGTFIARTATEVHGGMGFTDLVGLHYWFKRVGANRQLLGGPEKVRDDAARLQGLAA